MSDKQSFDEVFTDRMIGMLDPMADAMAEKMGGSLGTQKYSEADQLKIYNASPIADPNERAQTMLQMFQQGIHPEDITDQVYPERRKLIKAGRPKIQDQVQYAKQMDRLMARQARDQGIHAPYDDTWSGITAPNAPTEDTQASSVMDVSPPSVAPPASAAGGAPISPGAPLDIQPSQATSQPGWAQGTGSLFG
jgi:hypothetical protein